MDTAGDWVAGLRNQDDKQAYECLKKLLALSQCSAQAYAYFPDYVELMQSGHSYRRTRGMLLIAANAKWDTEYKLDEVMDTFLRCLMEAKPIEARQEIRAAGAIALARPDLADEIARALTNLNLFRYPDTMRPLIRKDIAETLKEIAKAQQPSI
jgi:hypothetical protein